MTHHGSEDVVRQIPSQHYKLCHQNSPHPADKTYSSMAFALHSYANSYDEILLLPNRIHTEKAFDGGTSGTCVILFQ